MSVTQKPETQWREHWRRAKQDQGADGGARPTEGAQVNVHDEALP
jgi:hypothetical protein